MKKYIFTLLLIVLLYPLLLVGSCFFLYQPITVEKQIAKPFLKNMKNFYLDKKRLPNKKELPAFLKKDWHSHGSATDRYDYNGYDFRAGASSFENRVDLTITYKKTFCRFDLEEGLVKKYCYKQPCLSFRQ